MIRINLLGAPKPKNKRSAVPAVTLDMGEPGSPKIKILIVVLLAASANGFYWYRLDRQSQTIAKNMALAEQKNRELADVKARYLEREREANNYKRRVDVIDQLRTNQARRHREQHGSRLAEHHEGHGVERRYRRHGAQHRCRGLADPESAEDGAL
jgi:hypothetical protein